MMDDVTRSEKLNRRLSVLRVEIKSLTGETSLDIARLSSYYDELVAECEAIEKKLAELEPGP